ncbi:MAG: hypothetical protein PQJ46_06565 [Spirochaetales bacterium]|nr:hypothetical protein [Spirochaetales bacterium]
MVRAATKKDASRIAEIRILDWRSAYQGIIPDSYLFSEISVTGRFDRFIEKKKMKTIMSLSIKRIVSLKGS